MSKKESQRRWYDKSGKAIVLQHKKDQKDRNRKYVEALKRNPCTDCGQVFPPEAMQFDHLGDDKRAAVSVLVLRPVSIETLQKEIDKCDLVCANCHAVRTHNRRASLAQR